MKEPNGSTGSPLEQTLRKSGIDAIGHAGWGTHFCQFYESKRDLLDMLVPYFEAGLKDNERCLWVASDPLTAEEAETAMVEALPDFKKYISNSQVNFRPASDWYLRDGTFDADRVISQWVGLEQDSRARGFEGLRVTGNTFWLDKTRWHDFAAYESRLNQTLGKHRIICVCSYCLERSTAADVLDVCSSHQFALTRRNGTWQLVESDPLAVARAELARANAELEARVEARTRDLELLLRERDEFLSMLSHELRNPLAPLQSAAEIIRQANPADNRAAVATDIVSRQVHALSVMLGDLLDAERTTNGMFSLRTERVALRSVLEDACNSVRVVAEAHRQTLTVEWPGPLISVDVDRVRLGQVFANVLINATQHAPTGGVISIHTNVEESAVSVTISDTGPGVPAEIRDRVFEPFVQGPTSLDRPKGGIGVGLAIARQIVEKHGGTLAVQETEDQRWADFVIRLPRASAADGSGPHTDAKSSSGQSTIASTRLKILVLDDEADIVEATAALLELNGHDVRTAFEAEGALQSARAFRPDVILADIGLPGTDGYEFARKLKSEPRMSNARLIAVTGYGSRADKEKARSAGFDAHLVKPVAPDLLLQSLPAPVDNHAHETAGFLESIRT
ncbi:Histidine kinase [Burkholderia sp. 8Y]|uniref:hybrid sensor histidine kinase/response regulator n=1 Tax=Burkholderia sp. 8Y TaxID=2653133 RepID=UPI0012EF3DD8|nr:MEDS domain-containing protein [Burkholderia sp. 8Y]VXB58108.1 Histidine kinase [Burkholderia sp. 8Y]